MTIPGFQSNPLPNCKQLRPFSKTIPIIAANISAAASRLVETWKRTLKLRDIPFTSNLNVTQMLSATSKGDVQAQWTVQGLPSDEHSVQNATIVMRSSSYPLLIDPQVGFLFGCREILQPTVSITHLAVVRENINNQ